MLTSKQIYDFSIKWHDKFCKQDINYIDLVNHHMADECDGLGFKMDYGREFSKKYKNASYNYQELDNIVDYIYDIKLLGSAIYWRWRYFNNWAHDAKEILDYKNRAWFLIALKRLAALSKGYSPTFEGNPKSINIVSINPCSEIYQEGKGEIEQYLTINNKGQVEFLSLNYDKEMQKYDLGRKIEVNIDKSIAQKILDNISSSFKQEKIEIFAGDVDDWYMEIINKEDKVFRFRESTCEKFDIESMVVSELIRNEIDIKNLYAFDGNYKADRVNSIHITYFKSNKGDDNETKDSNKYTENLIIDRKRKTLQHLQDTKTGYMISRKIQIGEEINTLLDELDIDTFFKDIEENIIDETEEAKEIKQYKIVIDYEKRDERIITGRFDKKGLPKDWAEFAVRIKSFIESFNLGHMLDASKYNQIRSFNGQYIFCSVVFKDSYKSYYYLTDDETIKAGDYVIVPAGRNDYHKVVEVVNVESFDEENLPLALDKTKAIIRKCTEDEF